MKINNFLKQEDQQLITTKDMTLTIDLSNYNSTNMLVKEEDKRIWVKSLLAKAEYDNIMFDVTLDYALELLIYEMEQIGKEYIKLKYEANSPMLEVSTEAGESAVQISYVERLIGGREILKDAAHLYRKLFAVYGKLSNMDSAHLEVMCSQVLRDKKNVQIPARMGRTWDPQLVNLKKVIFSTGFVNGLAFENINDAIKTGLISEESGDPSIIEKVMTGSLVDEGRGKSSRLGDRTYKNR
jgi:hypothetical protein